MNTVAAALAVFIAAAHSYLGERYILTRLFRRGNLPELFGGTDFTRQTLRFAWHLTSVAWVGFAALLLQLDSFGPADRARVVVVVVAVFGVTGAVALVASRGRHLSWLVFFAIAALTWWGSLARSAESGRLPRPLWVLVDAAAAQEPGLLRDRLRKALTIALRESRLLESSYPLACRVTRTPVPNEPGRFDVTCPETDPGLPDVDGLRLDTTGRFLELRLVDFPDSRAYVMAVFVTPTETRLDLDSEEGWETPRVVVGHFPVLESWHPEIWTVLDRAVVATGATPVER